jgi:hypothetical protein
MSQDVTTYYLVKTGTEDASGDYGKILSVLNAVSGLTVDHTGDTEVTLTWEEQGYTARLAKNDSATSPMFSTYKTMVLYADQTDMKSVTLIREIMIKFGYRVYNTRLNAYMPADPYLYDAEQLIPNEKFSRVFGMKKLKPVFVNTERGVFYCVNKADGAVHIINNALLAYFMSYDVGEEETPEFSYEVAPDLPRFSAMYDAGIVPTQFYEYFNRSLKIINYSYMNVWRITRKIFVLPLVVRYDRALQDFVDLMPERSRVQFADKVRKGENLDIAIRRILRDELKAGDDYLRAKVSHIVEFDRDRDDILTPRITVVIYTEDAVLPAGIRAQSHRGWTSLGKRPN